MKTLDLVQNCKFDTVNTIDAGDTFEFSDNQKPRMTISEKERRAVMTIKNSLIYSGLGHCTNCLQRLTASEKQKFE